MVLKNKTNKSQVINSIRNQINLFAKICITINNQLYESLPISIILI